MKLKESCLAIIAVALGLVSVAHATDNVSLSTEAPKDVFTPKGFDDDDNVEIVLTGGFSNFCYHVAPSRIQVSATEGRIYVDNPIYSMDHCKAGMMYIPYARTVDIGVLAVGNYEIWVSDANGGYEKRADLPVVKSRPSAYSPDDELYAPVSEVSFQAAAAGAEAGVIIRGSLNNTCLKLTRVQVNERGNTVEILPQVAFTRDVNCRSAVIPFSRTVQIADLPEGDVLIHVRSMGGQSVNRVITALDRLPLN